MRFTFKRQGIFIASAAAVLFGLLTAVPALATDGTAGNCNSHNADSSVMCTGGSKWCGNTCQAQPSCPNGANLDKTVRDCNACGCNCPASAPNDCTATNNHCQANNGTCAGQFRNQACGTGGALTMVCGACISGYTDCAGTCRSNSDASCPSPGVWDACGLSCSVPYVRSSPASAQGAYINVTGNVTTGGDLYMSSGKALRIDGSGTSTLNIGNWGGGASGLNVNVGSPSIGTALKLDGMGNSLTLNRATGSFMNRMIYSTGGTNEWQVGQGLAGATTAFSIKQISSPPDTGIAAIYIDTAEHLGIFNSNPATTLDINGALTIRQGSGAPAVAPAGQGRIYFDIGSNKLKASQNGAAYVDLVSSMPSGAANQTLRHDGTNWVSSGTLLNNGLDVLIGAAAPVVGNYDGGGRTLAVIGGNTAGGLGNLELGSTSADADGKVYGTLLFVHGATSDADKRLVTVRGQTDGATANDRGGRFMVFVQNNGTNTQKLAIDARQDGTVELAGLKLSPNAGAGKVLTSDASGVGTWQAAAASGVGGSGTATYVPKFTAASTLGNSQIIDNGTNVGIGTSPSYKLHVIDSSNTGLRVQTNAVGGTVASYGGNGDFMIDAPGISGGRFTVKEDGKVGIGTASPGSRLEVDHDGASVFGVGLRLNQYQVGNSDGPKIEFYKTMTSSMNWTVGMQNGVNVSNFAISSGAGTGGFGTPRLTMDTSGTLFLNSKDTIESNDSWLRLNQGGAYTSGIHTPGFLNAGSMTVGANYSSPGVGNLTITGNLNVGGVVTCIQGYCPSNNAIRITPNLHLNSMAGSAVIANWDNGTTGTAETFRIGNGAAGGNVFAVNANGDTIVGGKLQAVLGASASGSYSVALGRYTDAGGNDSVALGYNAKSLGRGDVSISTCSTDNNNCSGSYVYNYGNHSIAIGSNLQVGNGDTYNVLIGNNISTSWNSGTSQFVIGSGNASWINNGTPNSLMVGFNSNTPTLFVGGGNGSNGSTGNVGIGTTGPGYKLTVAGDIGMTGNPVVNNTSPTMYFQDTDNRSAMIHNNSNLLYVLRGSGNNSLSWEAYGGRWPLTINLENNDADVGGNLYAGNVNARAGMSATNSINSSTGFGATSGYVETKYHLAANGWVATCGQSWTWAGYTFSGDGCYDTGMFSDGDGILRFFANGTLRQTYTMAGTYAYNSSEYSDKRLKENIQPYADGLELLRKINTVSFTYNGLAASPEGVKSYGVIAQEVQKVIPYAVTSAPGKLNPTDTEDTDILAVDMQVLSLMSLNAIKELDAELQRMKIENGDLKARIEALEAKLR